MSDIVFGLMLTLIGTGIVILTLLTLQVVIMLMGAADRWASRRPAPAAAPPPAAADDAIPADVLAAIAAAVTVALREPIRIHHIHIHQDETQAAWSRIDRKSVV